MPVSAAVTSRLYESGVTDFLGAGERDAILAMPAMPCLPVVAVVAAAKGPAAMPTGKVEAAAREEVDVFGDSKGAAAKAPNEDGGGSAPAAGSDGSSTKSADGGTSEVRCDKKGHWRVDCTELLCSRCHGRGIAADVSPTSKGEAVLAASDDDDDYDMVEASALRPERQASGVMVQERWGKGSRLGRYGMKAGFAIVERLLTWRLRQMA